jgi:hypothetical protein
MSHTLHESQKSREEKNRKSRSVPLVGRDTIADYGMLCDDLLLVLCCLESCLVDAFARSTRDTLF